MISGGPSYQSMHHTERMDNGFRREWTQGKYLCVIAGIALVGLLMVVLLTALIVPAAVPYYGSNSQALVAPERSPHCPWCAEVESDLLAMVPTSLDDCTGVWQSNFSHGSVFLSEAGCYQLKENIVFDPSEASLSTVPYVNNSAFRLGFFAAVIIDGVDIVFDLGGFEIKQSVHHNLHQRFFAVIEVADRPFIMGQGPADFSEGETEDCVAGKRIVIQNGHLGLSSHHGIHGNDNSRVLLKDLTFSDYEVACVALNGVTHSALVRVDCKGTSQKVPVKATFSAAHFIMPFVDAALAKYVTISSVRTQLIAARTRLHMLKSEVNADVLATGKVNHTTHPEAYALFGNPSGLSDGGSSGIIIHPRGVAVNGFQCDRADSHQDTLNHVMVAESSVHNVVSAPIEVVALRRVGDDAPQRGPAGDLLRIADVIATDGTYAGNALSDVQILLSKFIRFHNGTMPGTLHIDPLIEQWQSTPGMSLAPKVSDGTMEYLRNGDSMFHVAKGNFGVRIGGGHRIALIDTSVFGVENRGTSGISVVLPGENHESMYYTDSTDGGHPGQDPQQGYTGGDARGVSVAAASAVVLDSVSIRGVHSALFWAFGVDIFNDAGVALVSDLLVYNVSSFTDTSFSVDSPKGPQAIGLHTTTAAERPNFFGTTDIQDIVSGFVGVASRTLYEDSPITKCATQANFYGL